MLLPSLNSIKMRSFALCMVLISHHEDLWKDRIFSVWLQSIFLVSVMKYFCPLYKESFFRRDLAALNIMRGRDNGLADYNTVRKCFGFPMINNFSEINQEQFKKHPDMFTSAAVCLQNTNMALTSLQLKIQKCLACPDVHLDIPYTQQM